MRKPSTVLAFFALTCAAWTAAAGQAQKSAAQRFRAPAGRQPDRVANLIRREAEAENKARQEEFVRLNAIPLRPEVKVRVGPQGRLMLRLRERPEEEEADETAPGLPEVIVEAEVFDQFMFGSTGDAESGRAYAATVLDRLINKVASSRPFTPEQRQKLVLAGRGDIKRLFDRIEEERTKFEALRSDLNKCEQFLLDLRPLHKRLHRGPFESDSLFSKTLKKMVEDEKLARTQMPASAPVPP
jgi:hypothetical protein